MSRIDGEIRSQKQIIDDLILELSLASALPLNMFGRNLQLATSAANSFAYHAENMKPKEIKLLDCAIGPLLHLMYADIDNPVAAKSALGIRMLMASRHCILEFMHQDGLLIISKIFDILMGFNMINFREPSTHRSIVENCIVCYREISRYYPWKIVDVGGLRHLVILVRYANTEIKTVACTTLAMLSQDMAIVKQMFSYGAIKPLINAADVKITNEACTLAAFGCLVQLCKVPEFATKLLKQGVVSKLEIALHTMNGYCNKQLREKSLYAYAWLSKMKSRDRSLICSKPFLDGVKRELQTGTRHAKITCVQMMLNLHNYFPSEEIEEKFVTDVRDILLTLMSTGMWHARNLCIKTICVLYRSPENKIYFARNGAFQAIIELISAKNSDLQEATMVALLSMITHPEAPYIFIEIGGIESVAPLLLTENVVVRELTIVFFKALSLYDAGRVKEAIPDGKEELFDVDDIPMKYGGEYGGLIEEYLQSIVENRRDEHYLIKSLTQEEIEETGVTQEELISYENTFFELDMDCSGALGLDEMKMLMVMLGETFDKYELQDLLEEYDADGSGELEFNEFVVMMKGWNTRQGKGAEKVYNDIVKRGAFGRAYREFSKWWNQGEADRQAIEAIKAKKRADEERKKADMLKYMEAEKLKDSRSRQDKLRNAGLKGANSRKRRGGGAYM